MSAASSLVAAIALSLVACTSVASSGGGGGDASGASRIADGSTFTMAPGEMVFLADASTLRYDRVANDSRCKPDVQCVWAGDAEVAFTWHGSDGGRDSFSLHTGRGEKSHAVGGRTLTLVDLARGVAPEATLKIDAGG